jgi:hypothetical protein
MPHNFVSRGLGIFVFARTATSSLLRSHHFRDAANAGVACKQVSARIHCHVIGFDKLAFPSTGSVAYRAEHVAIPVDLEDLSILPGRHPQLAIWVDIQGAYQVSHLNRFDKPAVPVINDDAIFLTVTNVNVAVVGIDRDPMDPY